MYSNKLVLAIKSSGKILREVKDTVMVPFGSEYSLLVKNLNTVRALISVTIDGTNATEGVTLVVPANGEVELERFIKGGNTKSGNRFKFIERSAAVEGHRGIKADDGLIRIEFQFEKVFTYPDYDRNKWATPGNAWPKFGEPGKLGGEWYGSTNAVGSAGASLQSTFSPQAATKSASSGVLRSYVPQNDAGITVPGSVSDQKFEAASYFPVETEKHVMVLRMIGETDEGIQIVAPVTVQAKPKCTTCGRVNKATAKFCTECGTSLTLI